MKRGRELENYEIVVEALDLDNQQKELIKEVWGKYFLLLDKSAKNKWLGFTVIQTVIIILGSLIPIFESNEVKILGYEINNVAGVGLVSIFGVIISVGTAMNRLLRYEDKWTHFRRNAEYIRNEGTDYFALSGNYKEYQNHREGFRSFISNTTNFKRAEVSMFFTKTDKNSEK